MRLSATPVDAYGIKFSRSIKGKEVARAFLYVITNGLHDRPFGLLEDVFVEKSLRGDGTGTALVRRVIAEAKKRGCYKLIATSRHARDRVHALYLKLGFADHGKEFRIDFK